MGIKDKLQVKIDGRYYAGLPRKQEKTNVAVCLTLKIEKAEERYKKLLENIEGDLVFSKDGDCVWQCLNCGHIVIGKKAPEVCPVCAHPQSYFQVKPENY
ncbi:MAG: rubrerythrin family protein [Eubacterium sp.]